VKRRIVLVFWFHYTEHRYLFLFLSRLTAWKAFDYWKKDVNTPLITVIWRDGVLYFFAIFSMNVVNVLIFLAAPQSLRAINLT